MELNLDKLRAATDERSEGHTLIIKGEVFDLPPRVSMKAIVNAVNGNITGFLFLLLGEESFDRFTELEIDDLDLRLMADHFADLYDISVGESRASVKSSSSTTRRSRPTSKGSTATTSQTSSQTKSKSEPVDSAP